MAISLRKSRTQKGQLVPSVQLEVNVMNYTLKRQYHLSFILQNKHPVQRGAETPQFIS